MQRDHGVCGNIRQIGHEDFSLFRPVVAPFFLFNTNVTSPIFYKGQVQRFLQNGVRGFSCLLGFQATCKAVGMVKLRCS